MVFLTSLSTHTQFAAHNQRVISFLLVLANLLTFVPAGPSGTTIVGSRSIPLTLPVHPVQPHTPLQRVLQTGIGYLMIAKSARGR